MKRISCLALAAVMALMLTACGGDPKFDASALTEAQAYAKAAMDEYTISKDWDVKYASVLLTSDLKADLQSIVELKSWDVSDVTALVLVQTGKEEQSPEVAAVENKPLLFLLDEDQEIVYKKALSGGSNAPSTAAAADDSSSDSDAISELRRQVAQAQLDAENFAALENVAEFAAQVDSKLAEDPDYLTSDAFFADAAGNEAALEYGGLLRDAQNLEKRLDAFSEAEDPSAIADLLDSDEDLQDQTVQLRDMLQEVNAQLADQNPDVLAPLKAVADKALEDPSVLFTEEYLRQCLTSEDAIQCDSLLRQKLVDETSLETLAQCGESDSVEERTYLQERNAVVVTAMADYAKAMYEYVQKDQAQKEFETAHETELSTYRQEESAIKERAGKDYEEDLEYVKLQLKYEEMLQEQEKLKNETDAAKKAADKVKSEAEEDVKKLDNAEKERKASGVTEDEQAALYEYVCAMDPPETSEYQVEAGQWGRLHADFIPYLNENLNYPSSSSSSSSSRSSSSSSSRSSSSSSSSSSRGSSSDDYSFEDYLRDNDPESYEYYQDLERGWNSGTWDSENGFFQ